MTPVTFHILLSLADSDKHGYAIMQEVESLSSGKIRIGPGTLYSALQRLVEEGWIEELSTIRGDDARRRTYRLTRQGKKAASEEAAHLRDTVDAARRRRLLPNA